MRLAQFNFSAEASNDGDFQLTCEEWVRRHEAAIREKHNGAVPIVPESTYAGRSYFGPVIVNHEKDRFASGEKPTLMLGSAALRREKWTAFNHYWFAVLHRYIRIFKVTCTDEREWVDVANSIVDRLYSKQRAGEKVRALQERVLSMLCEMVRHNRVLINGKVVDIKDEAVKKSIQALHAIEKRLH